MECSMKWGEGEVSLSVPDGNVIAVLEPSGGSPIDDLGAATRALLKKPTSGPPLARIARSLRPKSVAIIVNDATRSTPTAAMLVPLLEELRELGFPKDSISIVVATGTHRAATPDEVRKIAGEPTLAEYRIESHDCDAPDLVDMGRLSTGNRLLVNRTVAKAELRLAIGEVLLHYYAGFAGGRKSVLPGVAGRETIMANHRMMTEPGAGIGIVEGNPLSAEMAEAAAERCPLHFILNAVSDSSKRIIAIVGGHWLEAWREGIEVFRKYNVAPIDERADVAFLSAGGYPKDINMYQAHKALYMASRAVRPGGTLVFFAELAEGFGHAVFEEWARRDLGVEGAIAAFERDFRFGAHKLMYLARLARESSILLYSRASEEDSRLMFCEKAADAAEIVPLLAGRYGSGFRSYVIPQAGIVLPVARS